MRLEEQYLILDADDLKTFEKAKELLEDGWVKSELPYNPFGTDVMRLLHLVKYTEEELAEIEARKQQRTTSPRPPVDQNCLTVPILKYEEDKEGKENPYKILTSKGYREVHRTSTVAVMKLTDPRGVLLSDEDIELILKLIDAYYQDNVGTEEYAELKTRLDGLHYRLFTIYEESQAVKAAEQALEEQPKKPEAP